MKVSVITICYNSAVTIAKTLTSVHSQTFQDIEHILIDGASRDNTLEIIRETPNRVAYLSSEPDSGIYDAMNKGLAKATGDLVCFLNADDVYADSEIIESVVHEFRNADLDVLYGDVAFFRSDMPEKIVRRFRSDKFAPKRIAWGWMPAHPSLFMRRELYARLGGFKTDYRIAGDYEFVARAFVSCNLKYRYLPRVLVLMQAGGVSTAGWRSTLLLNREVLRACRENGISTNLFKILSKYPAKLLELLRK